MSGEWERKILALLSTPLITYSKEPAIATKQLVKSGFF